jgi:PBSX family phage terminase large subunit
MEESATHSASQAAREESRRRSFIPRGSAREALACREKEMVIHGPSGTGKSRTVLEKLYGAAMKYPGMRGAIVRRFRSTITQSAMNTFDELVRTPGDKVRFYSMDQEYRFPNGSVLVVAGLDDPVKVLSTEYDIIYVQECTEIDEQSWQLLLTRLRWNHMPYQQLIGDCNPSSDKHWIRNRWKRGQLFMLQSKYEDNPMWWDFDHDDWTPAGADYISKLDALTGHMYDRFRLGKWVGAEGTIFSAYKPEINLVDPFELPAHWTRYVTIDWGYQNPMSVQWWAEDYDGRLFLYREIYEAELPVEDMAHEFFELSQGESYAAIICDQDAEDRATFERHAGHPMDECTRGRETEISRRLKGHHVPTQPADKSKNSVRSGIEKVQNRLKVAADGHPRLFLFRNTILKRNTKLQSAGKPTCLEEEIGEYVWDKIDNTRLGEKLLEMPKKVNDHACDAMRYLVSFVDERSQQAPASIWGSSSRNTYRSAARQDGPTKTLWGSRKDVYWTERYS